MKPGYLFLLLCFLVTNAAFSQLPIHLNKEVDIAVREGFTFFKDSSKTLQVDDILHAFAENKFVPSESHPFERGYKVYWLHFSLRNTAEFDKEWILDFQNWSLVDLFKIEKEKVTGTQKTGHLYPYRKRDYKVANKSYLAVPIKSGETKEYFVRIESKYNNELIPDYLGFTIRPESLVDQEAGRNEKIIFSFLSVFLFMFIYILFIFTMTRIKSYGFYLMVIFFAFYHTSYNSGHLVQLFGAFDSFPAWITIFENISSNLFGLSGILFLKEFFRVKERYPGWYKAVRILLLFLMVSGAVIFIHPQLGMALSSVAGLTAIVTIISIAVKSTRDNYPASKYFLMGYSASCISILMILLCMAGAIPKNDWTFTFSVPVGSFIEIVFFSLALANMIKVLHKENKENETKQLRHIQEKEEMKLTFQQELLKTQLEIEEQTFHNIGGELHDNIGQILSLVKINMNTIDAEKPDVVKEKLSYSKTLLSKAIQDLRDLSKSLSADYFNGIGLENAIQQQLYLLQKTGAFATQFIVKGSYYRLPPQCELVAFRIVQELLNNIVKHAGATLIVIMMDYQKDKLLICVQDNGKGFEEPTLEQANGKGVGLYNIKNRIKLLQGSIAFECQPEAGTVVRLSLPK